MPMYLFQNPETKEIKEVFFHMNDEKVHVEGRITWNRIYTVPQASIDTKADPFSPNDFVKVTAKNGTYGDLLDRSAEMSEARAAKAGGVDPIKEKFYDEYSAKRHGMKHPDVKKREANARLKKRGIKIK